MINAGIDAHGTVCLNWDFDVTLSHSKASDSNLPSLIQGEEGTLAIDKGSYCQGVVIDATRQCTGFIALAAGCLPILRYGEQALATKFYPGSNGAECNCI